MDAVNPSTMDKAEHVLAGTPGVLAVNRLRMRWVGHQLHAETDVVVDNALTVIEAHAIAVDAEHRLLHEVPPSLPLSRFFRRCRIGVRADRLRREELLTVKEER